MAESPKKLLFVRHGTTGPNWQGKFIGATDVGLAGKGPEQARHLGIVLRRFSPQICFASPMTRVRQTMEFAQIGCPVQEDSRLKEIDFGAWEGMTFDDIAVRYPDMVDAWAAYEESFFFPDGERVADFIGRLTGMLDALLGRPEEIILVATHGGVIRTMICLLLGLSFKQYLLFDVQPATVAVVETFGRKGILAGLNIC